MNNENKYIIISGATATGKTSISIELAKYLKSNKNIDAEIINFDSLLFYKELNIGTAKPLVAEIGNIKHHLIDIASISTPLNASQFRKLAEKKIDELFDKKILPILVGGSAFYIRALVKGMFDSNQNKLTKITINRRISGLENIITYLKNHDPEIFEHIHQNDEYRLSRAAEFHLENNRKYSDEIRKTIENKPYDFSVNNQINGKMLHVYLEIEKEKHLDIIHKRAHQMIKNGLIEEVGDLLNKNYSSDLKPLQSIGYKETINFIESKGKLSIDELLESINISTRQLAKSQKTFFRKITPKHKLCPLAEKENLLKLVDDFLK